MCSPKEAANRLEELGFFMIREYAREDSEEARISEVVLLLAVDPQRTDGGGAMQLRPGEEDSCLWQLRTQSAMLREQVKERLDKP